MLQEKYFGFNVCYNLAMSEAREGAHGKGRYGDPPQRDILRGVNVPPHRSRKPLMSGLGMFDEPSSPAEVSVLPEKPHRSFWFKKGTRFYSTDYKIPRTPREEEDRRAGELDEAQEIEISSDNLVYSERLQRLTPRAISDEYKSRIYGAFVKASIYTRGRRGENIVTERFISLKGLQKAKDNPFARFKEATRA